MAAAPSAVLRLDQGYATQFDTIAPVHRPAPAGARQQCVYQQRTGVPQTHVPACFACQSAAGPEDPEVPDLQEDNVRQGFLTADQYANLVAHCDELWLRALVVTAVTYGWRVGELLNLRVRQVNLVGRTIRLEPGETKNREGREVVIASSTLLELLRQCVTGKDQDDHVFTRGDKPVRDFRKSSENLCTTAGVPGLLFHDLRRTAARNLRAAGVPQEIIMRIAGWKTPGVFRRYAIVDQADVREALQKVAARQERIQPY